MATRTRKTPAPALNYSELAVAAKAYGSAETSAADTLVAFYVEFRQRDGFVQGTAIAELRDAMQKDCIARGLTKGSADATAAKWTRLVKCDIAALVKVQASHRGRGLTAIWDALVKADPACKGANGRKAATTVVETGTVSVVGDAPKAYDPLVADSVLMFLQEAAANAAKMKWETGQGITAALQALTVDSTSPWLAMARQERAANATQAEKAAKTVAK